jgi:hypothetical protein
MPTGFPINALPIMKKIKNLNRFVQDEKYNNYTYIPDNERVVVLPAK